MQDQDCYGGCFDPSESFNGELAVVRLWRRALPRKELDASAMRDLPADVEGLCSLYVFDKEGLVPLVDGEQGLAAYVAIDKSGGWVRGWVGTHVGAWVGCLCVCVFVCVGGWGGWLTSGLAGGWAGAYRGGMRAGDWRCMCACYACKAVCGSCIQGTPQDERCVCSYFLTHYLTDPLPH